MIIVHYSKTKRLWCTVIECFKRNLYIPLFLPQSGIFGFLEADGNLFLILNHLLLLFNYAYVPGSSKVLSLKLTWNTPWTSITLSQCNKKILFTRKWKTIQQNFSNFNTLWGVITLYSVMLSRYYSHNQNSVTYVGWSFLLTL